MKVLVFGKSGQVAQEMARRCPAGTAATFLGRDKADLTDAAACERAIAGFDGDVVINVAAFTDVDGAEENAEVATAINARAPGAMARACAAKSLPFLHVSSDYVFDGSGKTPFKPSDATAPINAYGNSKRAGEIAVSDAGGRPMILRTSWVVSAHGRNFVKTMLRLGAERESLSVVADQIGGLTPAAALADTLYCLAAALADGADGGTYHYAGTPDASWADVAREVMAQAGLACRIDDIATRDYPTPARRPLNSRLDCDSLLRDFSIRRPDWRKGLHDILTDLGVVT